MIFRFKKREAAIAKKEQEIQAIKSEYHESVNRTLGVQKEINKVLSNGITLKIYHATGHKK